jgi:hypothetical protein
MDPIGAQTGEVRYPIPPAARGDSSEPADTFAAPAAALRMPPQPARAPEPADDLAIDPMSLRGSLRLHAGVTTLTVDDHGLTLRTGMKRTRIPWTDVLGFQPQFEPAGAEGITNGSVVAVSTTGLVELRATRGSVAEVRYAHAMLEAYQVRARLAGNG